MRSSITPDGQISERASSSFRTNVVRSECCCCCTSQGQKAQPNGVSCGGQHRWGHRSGEDYELICASSLLTSLSDSRLAHGVYENSASAAGTPFLAGRDCLHPILSELMSGCETGPPQSKAPGAPKLPFTGILDGLSYTVRTTGFLSLYDGLGVTLLFSIPKAGIRFGGNAYCKTLLADDKGKLTMGTAKKCLSVRFAHSFYCGLFALKRVSFLRGWGQAPSRRCSQ